MLNIEFPRELTQEFFEKVHRAGDVSYLPSSKLNNEESLPIPLEATINYNAGLDFSSVLDDEGELTFCTTFVHEFERENKEFKIPYVLRQRYSRAERHCNITFQLLSKNFNLLNSATPVKKEPSRTELELKTIVQKGSNVKTICHSGYFQNLQENIMKISYENLQLLLIEVSGRTILAPHISYVSENFSQFNLPNSKDKDYLDKFNDMYFLMGLYSYLPREFELPKDASEKDDVFHFQPNLSPLCERNFFYNDDKVNYAKNEFFFQVEDLMEKRLVQRPIDLKSKLLLMLEHLLHSASPKEQKALKIAILKFKTCKGHISIYDEEYQDNKEKKDQAKFTAISRKLSKVESLIKEKFPSFPNSKKDWDAYKKDPAKYLSQDEVFKQAPIK